ncbi:putative thioredoxin-like protein [Magnetospirillum sp. LM-5]|uniref:thioredoxin family protein n=1 Tax=Magnetospirillum sp. LM-5 TaxID=2681466 RepID=UPI00137E0A01|nr:thioredoxin family protein [Magnetospirillum sp. LM-5]CAA7620837.1 putative thioredoxin-like protein [Magnetospirillum sp. LM-5]
MKRWVFGLIGLLLSLSAPAFAKYEPKLGDDGLYRQDWFLNSFLDLREDLVEATKAGKRFAIIWEQKGCPYCRDVHTVNFADDHVRNWIKDRFVIVQLNLWGDREVTDFDGQVLTEKALARKYRVNFTPTIQFFPDSLAATKGKLIDEIEVSRMPGYFKNFHFLAMFEYVWDKRYAKGQEFQRYILEKANQ